MNRRSSTFALRIRAPSEEAARDMEETLFTPTLRELWTREPAILAAVFVDDEGETVDYCSAISPYEARVAGAHMRLVMDRVRTFARGLGAGHPSSLEVAGVGREFVVRALGEGYALVVVLEARGTTQALLGAVEEAVTKLRREAGIAPPPWDPFAPGLHVSTRRATGWPFAPTAFVEGGRRQRISDVLGRWEEGGGVAGEQLVCFRVRTEADDELTLAYDPTERRWMRW